MRKLPDALFACCIGAVFGVLLPFRFDFFKGSKDGDNTQQYNHGYDDYQRLIQVLKPYRLDRLAGNGGNEHRRQGKGAGVADSHNAYTPGGTVDRAQNSHIRIDGGLQHRIGGAAYEARQQIQREG